MYMLKVYSAMLVTFFAIDIVWLGVVAKPFYQKHLGYLLRPSPNWPVAMLFYLLYLVGLLVFVVRPALSTESLGYAAGMGAFYGIITYGTYDLTNHATVDRWPWIVSVVDMSWGAVLCAAVASAGYAAGHWLFS